MRFHESFAFIAAYLIVGLCGCGSAQEDRTVEWSPDGKQVGFQHGQEGIFVADSEGGNTLEKIFTPDENVLATSTPLWSPTDKRLVFTTANLPENQLDSPRPMTSTSDSDSVVVIDANSHVNYTCWLRQAPQPDADQEQSPAPIFNASCNDLAYVQINLAIRWHPKGEKVLFIDRKDTGHPLFEYDLSSGEKRCLLPHSATDLVFDWSPDGSRLACVTTNEPPNLKTDGIWICEPDESEWWKVAGSENLIHPDANSQINRLRATRPAWTKDGRNFVCVMQSFSGVAPTTDRETSVNKLMLAVVESRKVVELLQGFESIGDLHWHPSETRIGLVLDGSSLHTIDTHGSLSEVLNAHPVRRFAGWDTTGRRMAYVTPDEIAGHSQTHWAFLFLPVRHARDRVFIIEDEARSSAQLVHSGMRITFPAWSPTEEKLSLWGTFSPTYSWIMSMIAGVGVRPGDPAAILDTHTGEFSWLAVNAHEKQQVGHYCMLKKDYHKAWQWYQEAQQIRMAEQIKQAQSQEDENQSNTNERQRFDFRNNVLFYEYLCLTKLGRFAEATTTLEKFQDAARFDFTIGQADEDATEVTNEIETNNKLRAAWYSPLIRDFYIAEVFMSLDSAKDGAEFFEQAYRKADDDLQRVSSALMWSQLLLLSQNKTRYAKVATQELIPALIRAKLNVVNSQDESASKIIGEALEVMGGMALLPLFAPEFLATLPPTALPSLIKHGESLAQDSRDETARLAISLFLRAAYQTTGNNKQKAAVTDAISSNPASKRLLGEDFEDNLKLLISTTQQLAHPEKVSQE
jgi:Tol biopolymer transport system component/tetratricopeptide (TPR) repeat protein